MRVKLDICGAGSEGVLELEVSEVELAFLDEVAYKWNGAQQSHGAPFITVVRV